MMAKVTIKATIHFTSREILILKKALTQYKLTCTDFDKPCVADLIELTEHWQDRVRFERTKVNSTINPYYLT